MIEVSNLSKEFVLNRQQRKELNTTEKTALAVDNISFKCEPGRVFSLLGPNGAGKTTTLRMLSTIFKPTSGTIKIAGIDAVSNSQEARKKIGFLTGSTGLYARLTPNELMKELSAKTRELIDRKTKCFHDDVHLKLSKEGINIVRWDELTNEERELATGIFHNQIFCLFN